MTEHIKWNIEGKYCLFFRLIHSFGKLLLSIYYVTSAVVESMIHTKIIEHYFLV